MNPQKFFVVSSAYGLLGTYENYDEAKAKVLGDAKENENDEVIYIALAIAEATVKRIPTTMLIEHFHKEELPEQPEQEEPCTDFGPYTDFDTDTDGTYA